MDFVMNFAARNPVTNKYEQCFIFCEPTVMEQLDWENQKREVI